MLLLITSAPHTPKAWQALNLAKSRLEKAEPIAVFFYADGAYTANGFRWQSADVPDVACEWVSLSKQYNIPLPVCISTALARGITDQDNALRHNIPSCNLKQGFTLVGLSELALHMTDGILVKQF